MAITIVIKAIFILIAIVVIVITIMTSMAATTSRKRSPVALLLVVRALRWAGALAGCACRKWGSINADATEAMLSSSVCWVRVSISHDVASDRRAMTRLTISSRPSPRRTIAIVLDHIICIIRCRVLRVVRS